MMLIATVNYHVRMNYAITKYYGFYIMLYTILFLILDVKSLKVTEVIIPEFADFQKSVTLNCKFELEGRRLYSLKWYKDGYEFFRYTLENDPPIQVFPVNGISLDLSESNITSVTLRRLNFSSSGSYICEVSTESPNFQTVVVTKNMTIIAYPEDGPNIYGIESTYNLGDYVTGNCTAKRSNPPTDLSWYINGDKVENWYLEKYPLTKENGPLYSSALGLRFQLEGRHFQNKGLLELGCKARITGSPRWEKVILISPLNVLANHRVSQGGLRNSDIRTNGSCMLFIFTFYAFIDNII